MVSLWLAAFLASASPPGASESSRSLTAELCADGLPADLRPDAPLMVVEEDEEGNSVKTVLASFADGTAIRRRYTAHGSFSGFAHRRWRLEPAQIASLIAKLAKLGRDP